MPEIMVTCRNCQTRFGSGFDIGAEQFSMKGNSTRCPKCRARVPLEDGVFTSAGGLIKRLRDLDAAPREQVEAAIEILRNARRDQNDLDTVAAELTDAAPTLSPALLEWYATSNEKWIAALDKLIDALIVILGIWYPIAATLAGGTKLMAQAAHSVLSDHESPRTTKPKLKTSRVKAKAARKARSAQRRREKGK
jgi:hypothetical protein